jgi:hypothetical protein
LVVVVVAVACGGEGELLHQTTAHDAAEPDAPMLAVCALCTSDAECATGVCKIYGDGYGKCSPTCTAGQAASQCTGSSMGFCNFMGYCMCPRYEPPMDAGIDDPPKDAPVVPPIDAGTAPIDGL